VAGLDPAEEIAVLTSKLASIEAVLDPAAMRAEAETLREQAGDPGLWADQDRAQKVTRRLSYLEAELGRLTGLRQRLGEFRQGDRQQVGRDRRDDAEPQFASEGIARRGGGGGYTGRCGERRARLRHDCRSPVAEASATALAVEEAKTKLRLKLENLTAQRRLTYVARRRRAAKMAVVGDRDHIFEVSKVHGQHDRPRRSLVKGQSIGPIGCSGLSTSERDGSDAQAPYAIAMIVVHLDLRRREKLNTIGGKHDK